MSDLLYSHPNGQMSGNATLTVKVFKDILDSIRSNSHVAFAAYSVKEMYHV